MRTRAVRTKMLMSLVVGGLTASAWRQAAAEPSVREPGGPVDCVVKITCDPALLPLTPESVRALLESSFVAGEACKQALQVPVVGSLYQVEFKPLPGGTAAAPAGAMPVTPMMGMMGGPPPPPPQAGGGLPPAPQGGGGYGMGGYGGYGGSGRVGEGGDSGGGCGAGPGAPTPDGVGGRGGAEPPEAPMRGLPGAAPGGPAMPGGTVRDRPVGPAIPRPTIRPPMLDIPMPGPRESSILGQIEVLIDGAEPRHNEAFLRAICERLQQALTGLWEKEKTSIDRQLEMTRDELVRSEKRLRDLQNRRRDLVVAGQGDLVPEAVMDQLRRLDHERQRMEMDLLGQQARLKALQQQIQATGERVLDASRDDAMIKPLQEKLELLREQLKRVAEQNKAGVLPESEVQRVRIAMSEAEAQLAEARRKVAQAGGGEVLGKLNTELAMLSVNVAETEARLQYIREQMERNRRLAGAADEYEMTISMEMPHARRAYEMNKLRVEELEQRMRTAVPPMVTVIGGVTSKPAK